MKTLVVGGTGPTGPAIVKGLLERGQEVAVLHRGKHETPELPAVEHIHCDPHFEESLETGIGERKFDLVIGMYGRTRVVASVMAGRCDRFLGVGGVPVYKGFVDPSANHPHGMQLLTAETAPLAKEPVDRSETSKAVRFAAKLAATERSVFALHDAGAFKATWLRYPSIYGPRNPTPWEWSVMKRIQDGRPFIIVPDRGLSIRSRMAAANASHVVLLAVDHSNESMGEVFNCADDEQYSLRQWIELVAEAVGGSIECRSLPLEIATPAIPLLSMRGVGSPHVLVDTAKARDRLQYSDFIAPRDAIEASVEWYLHHPVTPETHPRFSDVFDYASEDALVERYTSFISETQEQLGISLPEYRHSYAHPKSVETEDRLGR